MSRKKLSPNNKHRRQQYQQDKAYRERIKDQERKRYAKRNPKFKAKQFGKHAGKATAFSYEYQVQGELFMALSMAAAARVFGIRNKLIYQWIKAGKIPPPVLKADNGSYIYQIEEVDAMAAVLKEKLKGRGAFRPEDKEVIKAVHVAFATAPTPI